MEIKLSPDEQVAKNFVLDLLFKGLQPNEPCDENFKSEDFHLPEWYDDAKYKRGQQYFTNNRSGIMTSNLYGLFSLISEPMGAKLLDSTQQSSTPETAKKRYAATTLHMLSWYEDELKPGSSSWQSLLKVRKMHQLASRRSVERGYENIPQTAMSMTAFGFMGYAIIRPHLLAIKSDNDEDREAFVHVWAVIGSMLGIKDQYNMCLHPLPVVEIICHILNRYAFIPLLQLENPTFVKLGKAFIDGMSFYIPFSSFESRLFLARRLAGVPGYQYDVDLSKEFLIRQIFTKDELNKILDAFQKVTGHEYRKNMIFDENLYLLDIKRMEKMKKNDDTSTVLNEDIFGLYKTVNDLNNNQTTYDKDVLELIEFLGLDHPSELLITKVDFDDLKKYQNDRKFAELSSYDQYLVKVNVRHCKNLEKKFLKPLIDIVPNALLYIMKRNYKI